MLRFLLLTAGLACVAAMTLRGVGAPAPAAASSSSKAAKKPFVDDRGERGHFYYAESCKDCFYKGAGCGCQPAMEYMACLTKHCQDSNETAFAEKCTSLGSKCFQEIDIDCRGPNTVCHSKFHQLPVGGVGLKVDVNEDEALCGPFGKCIGQLRMKATIVNRPKTAPEVVPVSGAPAPSAPASPAAPGPASAAPAAAEPTPIWLECGLPNKKKADIDAKEDWDICQAEADGDEAECELPLPDDWIKASESQSAYCLLKEGTEGKRLTQPSWHSIANVHDKGKKAAAKEEADKTEEPKKPKKAKKAKPDKKAKEPKEPKEAKEAEKPKEAKEEKDVKEPKEAKDEKKPKEAKDDKKPKEAQEKKEKKDDEKPEEESVDNSGKLPWMVDKEERQAERAAAKAKEAKKPKEAEKDEKKAPEKPESTEPHDSGLPWMEGKSNGPPLPGGNILK